MGRTATFKANERRLPTGMVPKVVAPDENTVEGAESEAPALDKTWKVAEIDAFAEKRGIDVSGTKNQKIAQIEDALAARVETDTEPEAESEPENEADESTEDAPAAEGDEDAEEN